MGDMAIRFAGETFQPLPCGALFWPAQALLLAADLHLEKGSSLARDGWLLPPYDSIETLDRLLAAVRQTRPDRLVLLGDSFHDPDGPNRLPAAAHDRLQAIAAAADIVWLAGNHDGLPPAPLPGHMATELPVAGLLLRHEPIPRGATQPQIGGHFHPKVAVPLAAGRVVRRRCLAVGPAAMILPAMGAYAGGLDIADPAIHAACGGPATAIVATPAGLLRLPPAGRQASGALA